MEIMDQGDKYEEEDVEVLEDTKTRFNKKLILVGAAVLVVGIAIAYVSTAGHKTSKVSTPTKVKSATSSGFTDLNGNPVSAPKGITYTEEEMATLRGYGYTGSEIEKSEQQGVSVQSLISVSQQEQQATLQKEYVELSKKVRTDPSSPEFKQLMSMTWLAGKPIQVTSSTPNRFTVASEKENCRYVKVPARGEQLFIKITLESDGQSVFYNVTPQRYYQMRSQGNIVITYDRITFGNHSYVTDIKEVPI